MYGEESDQIIFVSNVWKKDDINRYTFTLFSLTFFK